jgi:hypothetical protein
MLLDRNKHRESAYIGEELFGDPEKERMHKCMVAEQTIADGDFSLEEALEAYAVSKEEYEDYIADKSNINIFTGLSGSITTYSTLKTLSASAIYIKVIAKMLDDSIFEQTGYKKISRRMQKVRDELNLISKEIESKTAKA